MLAVRIALISTALLLAACASSPRAIDSQVRTDVATGSGADLLRNPHYRFEASATTAGQPGQDKLQAMAEQALQRVGAIRDDAHAKVSVQVDASVNAYWSDGWNEPSNPRVALGLGLGSGWRGGSLGLGFGWPFWDSSTPFYSSQVSLVIRDLASGAIIYSTQAQHDGPWHDTDTVLAALFVAALQGYPQPEQRARRVNVPVQAAEPATNDETPSVELPQSQPQSQIQ